MRFIDAAADRGNDLVDDAQKMRFVLEAASDRLEDAVALDISAFVTVDQDVVDRGIIEQRLERPEARHLVENFVDEFVEFLRVERKPLDHDVLRHELLDLLPHFLFGKPLQRREVDLLDEPAVQANFGVEQFVAEQRIGLLAGKLFLRLLRLRGGRPRRADGR